MESVEIRRLGWVAVSAVLVLALAGCSDSPKEIPIPSTVTSISTHDGETRVNVRYRVDNDQDFAGDAECDLTSTQGEPGASGVLTNMQPGERREDDINFDVTSEEAESLGYRISCTITET